MKQALLELGCVVRAAALSGFLTCAGLDPVVGQEEAKRAAENDEDTYLEATWANPKALKSSLLGTPDSRWG